MSTAVAEKPASQKRKPPYENRVDDATRFVIGQICPPGDLEPRGRGSLRAAFADLAERRGLTGPPSSLAKIPEGNMRAYEVLVMHAMTPAAAGSICFGVTMTTVARWLADGRADDCKDPMKVEFYRRTQQALAMARGDLEMRVAEIDPIAALTRGPVGRADGDVPGWSDARGGTLRLTNHTGDGPPEFTLEITTGGFKTRPSTPQLTEGGSE